MVAHADRGWVVTVSLFIVPSLNMEEKYDLVPLSFFVGIHPVSCDLADGLVKGES